MDYVALQADIVVIGAGLAGITAALEAARSRQKVALISAGQFCSGSSFYPGTFGLGLVAPLKPEDEEDFVNTISKVGCGLVNEKLSRIVVSNITGCIKELTDHGVEFRKPENAVRDNSLIPCFDHKHRNWFGYMFDNTRNYFTNELKKTDIDLYEHTDIIKIIKSGSRVSSVLGINQENKLINISTKAVIIASGGFGGIYQHNLNTPDINGLGQVLALEAGCELINLEFIQFMCGFISPRYKTMYNIKAFRHSQFLDGDGRDLLDHALPEGMSAERLLEIRTTHGPFTSRLASREIDIALFKECLKNGGVRVKFKESIKSEESYILKKYLEWLKESTGLGIDASVMIAPFAHAANGGICIKEDAGTGVPGIYAAGEVTGGMHGADRIGGLATANALVFGKIAGCSAAVYTKNHSLASDDDKIRESIEEFLDGGHTTSELKPSEVVRRTGEIMWCNGSIVRTDDGLKKAIHSLQKIQESYNFKAFIKMDFKQAVRAEYEVKLALAVLNAMLLRKESRGSHYREDFPEQSMEFEHFILVKLNDQKQLTFTPSRSIPAPR